MRRLSLQLKPLANDHFMKAVFQECKTAIGRMAAQKL